MSNRQESNQPEPILEERKAEESEADDGDDSDVEEYKAKKIVSQMSLAGEIKRLRTHEIQEFSEFDGVNIPYNYQSKQNFNLLHRIRETKERQSQLQFNVEVGCQSNQPRGITHWIHVD